MSKKSAKTDTFPSEPRTIVLEDIDENTWFHLQGTFDARISQFEFRLQQAKRFNDPIQVIQHYEWAIQRHKDIKESMRQQMHNPQ